MTREELNQNLKEMRNLREVLLSMEMQDDETIELIQENESAILKQLALLDETQVSS